MSPRARIEVIIHATEDAAKITRSLGSIGVDPDCTKSSRATGHFENEITIVGAELEKKAALRFAAGLARMLPADQARTLAESGRIDGSTMYLRLDKQLLVGGRASLAEGGAVRVRITAPVYKGDARKVFAGMLGLG